MIGLATNVVVRYLIEDDPQQAKRAARLIEGRCTEGDPGFINRIVLCEIVWVLESCYGYPKASIADVVERLLRTAELEIEDAEEAWLALNAYRHQGIDFPDALIGRVNQRRGCAGTATFDAKAARLEGFFRPD